MNIDLPVSVGEAIDKLTILDIKCQKITGENLIECQKEYNLLKLKLDLIISRYQFFYDKLLKTNLVIWKMQDEIRNQGLAHQLKLETSQLCLDIISENDNRFRIKKKINFLSQSHLKEQKGYTQKKAFVLSHLGLGDMINMIGAVRYLSMCYDEIKVVCKRMYVENVKLFYQDDPSIQLYVVTNDYEISVPYGCNQDYYDRVTQGYDVYRCGYHSRSPIQQVPLSFYDDFQMKRHIRTDYFYLSNISEATQLLQNVLNITSNYILIHQSASNQNVDFLKRYNINLDDERLVINPNQNLYPVGHQYYDICQRLLNCPVVMFVEIMKNAQELYLIDSCFFCLALYLDLSKVKTKMLWSRNGDYSYLNSGFIQL